MIHIENRRKQEKSLLQRYPSAQLLDLTSNSPTDWVKMSPFYPHGDIPIPFSNGQTAMSVEGIWQGLKVFEQAGVDASKFSNSTMKDLKRTVRKYGSPLGHRKGVSGQELLGYLEARIRIYLPAYRWVLENKVTGLITQLKEMAKNSDIVLLDYETNCDVMNPSAPLSHAALVKAIVQEEYPDEATLLAKLQAGT